MQHQSVWITRMCGCFDFVVFLWVYVLEVGLLFYHFSIHKLYLDVSVLVVSCSVPSFTILVFSNILSSI